MNLFGGKKIGKQKNRFMNSKSCQSVLSIQVENKTLQPRKKSHSFWLFDCVSESLFCLLLVYKIARCSSAVET